MAFYNQNYEAKLLTVGNYTTADLGNGLTASTIHELFCLSAGTINITAIGGGSFTWSATTSQSLNVMVGGCTVVSGEFVGFRSKLQTNRSQKIFY
jgi:hypothetical protein